MHRTHWLAVIAAVLFYFPAQAVACSCWHPTVEEYLRATAMAFEGQVISVTPDDQSARGGTGRQSETFRGRPSAMTARFKVSKTFKGSDHEEIDIHYYQSNGANCGSRFQEGQTVTVIATGNAKQGYSTGMCMMIPFSSAQRDKTNRFAEAFAHYRYQRDQLREQATHDHTPAAWTALARFFTQYRDTEDAAAAYEAALAIHPEYSDAILGKADLLFILKQYQDALATYEAAREISPTPAAEKGRALSLIKLGRAKEIARANIDLSRLTLNDDDEHRSFQSAQMPYAHFENTKLYQTDFSSANLAHADFSDAVINRSSFEHANLNQSSFQRTNIQNSSFNRASLDGADFAGATLNGSHFEDMLISNGQFKNTTLLNANLQSSVIYDTDMRYANLSGSNLKNATFHNVNFEHARFGPKPNTGEHVGVTDLRGADLSTANMNNTQWSYALYDCHTRLPAEPPENAFQHLLPIWTACTTEPPTPHAPIHFANSNVVYSRASHISFRSIDATGSNWSHRDFEDISFDKGVYDNSNFSGTNFRDANFRETSLINVDFSNARLTQARFSNSNLNGASFDGSDLSYANLYNINMQRTTLKHANLFKARLDAIDLRGADLSAANFENARLQRICYDKTTRWPDDFDIAIAGSPICKPVFLSSAETVLRVAGLVFLVFPAGVVIFIYSIIAVRYIYIKIAQMIPIPSKSQLQRAGKNLSFISSLWLITPYWPTALERTDKNIRLVKTARALTRIALLSAALVWALEWVTLP